MIREELIRRAIEAQKKLYICPEDIILFIVDNPVLLRILAGIFPKHRYKVWLIPPVTRPGQDYSFNEELLEDVTVAWFITGMSISHSKPTRRIMEKVDFLISNPGIERDWLTNLDIANRLSCQTNADRILSLIGGNVGGKAHITSDNGTDLIASIPNNNWWIETGIRRKRLKASDPPDGTNGPYGLMSTSPWNANGILVASPGAFITKPIKEVRDTMRFVVKNNRVIDIEGGYQAEMLMEMLDATGNPLAYELAEIGIGLNNGIPDPLLSSVIAEKCAGHILVAMGTNMVCLLPNCPEIGLFKYGRYDAKAHFDVIQPDANFTINGHLIAEKGKIVA